MTSFSEIEDAFFQQLHPVLSSKGMAITGKILKGLLKGTLKIDLDSDTKDDGSLTVQIPEINLPEYLKNTDKSILIFDDLERCQIDISNLLGYINYFVEHQGLKVILVANEKKLEKDSNYKEIKEKLIGKTFDIVRNLHGALESFIEEIDNSKVKSFLSNNIELIEEIYIKAKYENLRSLKQIILDFERIFHELPEKAKTKVELLQEILKTLIIFSIEIKRATIIPKDINNLSKKYGLELDNQAKFTGHKNGVPKIKFTNSSKLVDKNIKEKPNSITEIINIYKIFDFYIIEPFLGLSWWQDFFNLGKVNEDELEQSIFNSKYFADENTPNWIRLWHFQDTDMTDDEFYTLLEKVELEYANREFTEIEEILHITGLFLHLSDNGLYPDKNKKNLLEEAKNYIDDLVQEDKLDLDLIQDFDYIQKLFAPIGYNNLAYQGTEQEEFKEFYSYIAESQQSALEQKLPQLGLELLDIMQSDNWQFYEMLCIMNITNYKKYNGVYYKKLILKYIDPQNFMNRFLSMGFVDQNFCLETLSERYKDSNFLQELSEELQWVQKIQILLLNEADSKKDKLRAYRLNFLNQKYLDKIIEKLREFQPDQEVIEE